MVKTEVKSKAELEVVELSSRAEEADPGRAPAKREGALAGTRSVIVIEGIGGGRKPTPGKQAHQDAKVARKAALARSVKQRTKNKAKKGKRTSKFVQVLQYQHHASNHGQD